MRIASKPWLGFALIAVAAFVGAAALHSYRYRFVRSDTDLFRFLPQADATTFYVNVAVLRSAGVLPLLAAPKANQEAGYRDFVERTGFDYARDADAIAGSAEPKQISLLLRGRFNWNKLRHFGASCKKGICDIPTARTDRWISFIEIQPDVMAVALSGDHRAASSLRAQHSHPGVLPEAPVWIHLAHSLLSSPSSLPLAARLFAVSLSPADPVVLSMNRGNATAPFELTLDAHCANVAAADTVRNQLELDTKMLRLGLAREHVQAGAADVTGLLTAGTFQVAGTRVIGVWPVRQELLNALR